MNPIEQAIRDLMAGLLQELRPLVEALIAAMLRLYNEQLQRLTERYQAQLQRMGDETERMVRERSQRLVIAGLKAVGQGMWELAKNHLEWSIPVSIIILICSFLYARYRWRKFFWERYMLAEAKRQNDLTQELRDLMREQNRLKRKELGEEA